MLNSIFFCMAIKLYSNDIFTAVGTKMAIIFNKINITYNLSGNGTNDKWRNFLIRSSAMLYEK